MSLKDEWLKVKDKAAVVMLSSPLWNGSSVYTRIPEGAGKKAVEKVLKFFEDLVNDEPQLFKVVFLDTEGEVLATWEKVAEQPTVRRR
jgi:hypothetical protein